MIQASVNSFGAGQAGVPLHDLHRLDLENQQELDQTYTQKHEPGHPEHDDQPKDQQEHQPLEWMAGWVGRAESGWYVMKLTEAFH